MYGYEVQTDSGGHITVQDGHTLDLQDGMVQAVTDSVCYPFGHDDCNQQREHHAHVIADLHGTNTGMTAVLIQV